MPRKHRSKPHQPYRLASRAHKRRFANQRQAEAAANERMLLNPNLTLSVYRDIDGGWYLTSKSTPCYNE